MKRKVILISGIVVSAILILVFTGYNIYRDSAMLRNLSGHSSDLAQEEGLRSEILSQAELEMLTGEETVPEEIQDAGHTVAELENLPTYEYMQQEIEVYNEGQKIYGIACIPDTGEEKVPLAVCAHGLGGSYRSNIAYAGLCGEAFRGEYFVFTGILHGDRYFLRVLSGQQGGEDGPDRGAAVRVKTLIRPNCYKKM